MEIAPQTWTESIAGAGSATTIRLIWPHAVVTADPFQLPLRRRKLKSERAKVRARQERRDKPRYPDWSPCPLVLDAPRVLAPRAQALLVRQHREATPGRRKRESRPGWRRGVA